MNEQLHAITFASYLQGKEIKKSKEEGEAERRRTITETMWTHFGKQKKGDFGWGNIRRQVNLIGAVGSEQLFEEYKKVSWTGPMDKLFWKKSWEQRPF